MEANHLAKVHYVARIEGIKIQELKCMDLQTAENASKTHLTKVQKVRELLPKITLLKIIAPLIQNIFLSRTPQKLKLDNQMLPQHHYAI